MTALTNKTSSQSFFLRVLKVIIQLREAALLAIKKAQKKAKKEAESKKKEADAIANLLENKESEGAGANDFSHINSNHLCYFKFVGRVIAKAIYDKKLLECYLTRSFYKHILAKAVKHQVIIPAYSGHFTHSAVLQDMESEDYEFYKGLDFLLENKVLFVIITFRKKNKFYNV